MLVILAEDYDDLSKRAAQIVQREIKNKPNLTLGLATGNTPLGLYRELVRMHREEELDFFNVTTFNLDEYLGLPPEHPQSYHHYMWTNLFGQINIRPECVHIPDGSIQIGLEQYCRRYEDEIKQSGGIDLQILGIGSTGHIGFNEPTSSLASRTRVKTLAEPTIHQNQKSFGEGETVPPCAITMGIGTILEAKKILLLAAGASKSNAVARAIEGPVTSTVTASALQLHPDVTVVLDHSAAQELSYLDYYRRVYDMTLRWTPERVE